MSQHLHRARSLLRTANTELRNKSKNFARVPGTANNFVRAKAPPSLLSARYTRTPLLFIILVKGVLHKEWRIAPFWRVLFCGVKLSSLHTAPITCCQEHNFDAHMSPLSPSRLVTRLLFHSRGVYILSYVKDLGPRVERESFYHFQDWSLSNC